MARVTSVFRPAVALVIAHHDDGARRALILAVKDPESHIVVVGIAAETTAAHALVRRSAPDVALVELDLPWAAGPTGGGGLDVAAALARELPTCAVVLQGDDDRAAAAATVGAAGWLDAGAPPAEVVGTVRAVARREQVPHPSWVQVALDGADAALAALEPIDRAILEELAQGEPTATVARRRALTGHEVGRRAHDALARLRAAV